MDKKYVSQSNRISKKRRLSGIMAAVLVITGIGTGSYLQRKEVHAKPTLESISQVLSTINEKSPYEMLEIVPGNVPFSVSVNDSYGVEQIVSGNQAMGFLGYYVSGNEPVRSDIVNTIDGVEKVERVINTAGILTEKTTVSSAKINDANLRHEVVDSMLSVLEDGGVLSDKDSTILTVEKKYRTSIDNKSHYTVYKEIREGDLLDNGKIVDEATAISNGYKLLARNYDPYSDIDKNGELFIDSVKGQMSPSNENEKGNYIRNYFSLTNSGANPARQSIDAYLDESREIGHSFDGVKGGFDYSFTENRQGEFCINLTIPQDSVSANIYAKFEYDQDAPFGYMVSKVEPVSENTGLDTPVYSLDNGKYYYFGTYKDTLSSNATTVSENAPTVSDDTVLDNDNTAKEEIHLNSIILGNAPLINDEIETIEKEYDTLVDDNIINSEPVEDSDKSLEKSDESITEFDDASNDKSNDANNGENNESVDNTEDSSENKEEYYVVEFSFDDGRTQKTDEKIDYYNLIDFYGSSYEKGAQYILNDYDELYDVLIPVFSDKGCIADNGECSSEYFVYDYVKGYGNYSWTPYDFDTKKYINAGKDDVFRLRGVKTYYKLDLKNNEWFKQYVFDRDKGEQCKKLNLVVNTKIVSEVNERDAEKANLISIQSGSSKYCLGDNFTTYKYRDNDISYDSALAVLFGVVYSNKPLIMDYKIVSDYVKVKPNPNSDEPKEPVVSNLVNASKLCENDRIRFYSTMRSMGEESYYSDGCPASNSDSGQSKKDDDNHFVQENIYIYNLKDNTQTSNENYISFLNTSFYNPFSSGITEGFEDVLQDIQTENYYRQAENLKDIIDEVISQATAIRYIIGYGKKRPEQDLKGELRILEIQPCSSYDLSTNESSLYYNNKAIIDGNNSKTDVKISLTQMTTAEFIGRIEDINADYDLVYIGMNTGRMNTRRINDSDVAAGRATKEDQNKNKTIADYNDLNMDGLVYSNVGDYVYFRIHLAGMLDSEYENGGVKSATKIEKGKDLYKTRYSGNDLTKEKAEALKDFVGAGYPVILDDGFLTLNSKTDKYEVNKCKVDSASYMYDFVNSVLDRVNSKENVFRISNASGKLFKFYLNLSKPEIELEGRALASMGLGDDVDPDKLKLEGKAISLPKSSEGFYYAPFKFRIKNKGAVSATDKYYVNLYVDVNADGKYSATQESVDFTTIESADGTKVSKVTTAGYYNGTYEVDPDVWYNATYKISGEEQGVIPWRIVVRQAGDEGTAKSKRRANATGYYKMQDSKPTINVLQINSVTLNSVDYGYGIYGDGQWGHPAPQTYTNRSHINGDNSTSTINWGPDYCIKQEYKPSWNMEEEIGKGNESKFYRYLKDTRVPYDIQIKTVTSTEFSAMSKTYREKCIAKHLRVKDKRTVYGREEEYERDIREDDVKNLSTQNRAIMNKEIPGYKNQTVPVVLEDGTNGTITLYEKIMREYCEALEDYDMVIMGFGDCYVAPNIIAVDAIKDFIETGHSILFTHDCTSYIQALLDENGKSGNTKVIDGYSGDFGYECNKQLRNLVGMDRYNVLKNDRYNNNGNVDNSSYDSIYTPRTSRTENNKLKGDQGQIHGFTYETINTGGYLGTLYKGLYDDKYQGQAATEGLANLKEIDSTSYNSNPRTDSYGWTDKGGNDIYSVGMYKDMTVRRVNSGQITEYPFPLDPEFKVADTHGQYFQLDFTADDDYDGESDIVVWYTIDDSALVDDHKVDSRPADMYEVSPGDVRNNYYIYNKGNITYSGVGHSDVMKNGGSDNEIMLFINTMVAAYRSGLHAPAINFKESYEANRNTNNIYLTFDEQLEINRKTSTPTPEENGGMIGDTKDIYFMPEQVSLVQNAEHIHHQMSAKLYYEVSDTTPGKITKVYNGETVYLKELKVEGDGSGVYYKDPDTGEEDIPGDLDNLKNNAVYKVTFRLDQLGKFMGDTTSGWKDKRRLFVEATDSVTNDRTRYHSVMTAMADASFIRTEVFILD